MASTESLKLHRYLFPKIIIGRFVARRTSKAAALWAIAFGVFVASKGIGFANLYPTVAARQKIAETFSGNLGIQLLIGRAPVTATTAAYVAWNTANIMVMIGAIWAILTATKYFRGEEESGRAEVMLAGQTNDRRSALNIMFGLFVSLAVFFVVITVLLSLVGRYHGIDYGTSASLYFAFVTTLGIGLFMAIGALVSQIMPTRGRAASVTAAILGAAFLTRAIGDITSAHWLLDVSPLGWVEKPLPLANVQPLWLIPFIVFIALLIFSTVYLAGKRDYAESIVSDRHNTKPKYGLLKSPLRLSVRLTKANAIGWLSAIFLTALIYGLVSKSAGQAFSQSKSFKKAISHLTQQSRMSSLLIFIGIAFLIQMIIIMAYAASSIVAIRRDEAQGYIDNFLVQSFSRLRWLGGRLLIVFVVLALAGALTTVGIWIGVSSQHAGVGFQTILLASINALVPAVILAGVGILAFGLYPRLTSIIAYAVLVWSFLVELVGSGLNLNHWLLDTSIFHQVTLAPTVNPNWPVNLILVLVALLLAVIGAFNFNRRDIEGE